MDNERTESDPPIFSAYRTKQVDFRFRGQAMRFGLSHGLFSSADIDSGSRMLLKTVSALLDEDEAHGKPWPKTVLDAGSGVGVLGVAVAKALSASGAGAATVRAQDRDELARVFSARNAAENGLSPEAFQARAERLLAGPPDARYDLILSNLPAKAGAPVLADFYRRAGRMLTAGGRAATVIVAPLAENARRWIAEAGVPLLAEEPGKEYAVFVVGAAEGTAPAPAVPARAGADPYERTGGEHELEGVRYALRALHGVEDFSEPSIAVRVAAKLALRLPAPRRILVHESGQGHFPAFLAAAARARGEAPPEALVVGRNALALEASAENAAAAGSRTETAFAADLGLRAPALAEGYGRFELVASFPDIVPRVDRFDALWEGAALLAASGGRFIAALSSTDAERLDRRKTPDFEREGDLKRDGFRALAYRRR